MTTRERWDVVLKVLTGPLAGMGEQVRRGPVVRIGANPGPGGLELTGYRGLDARHAVITAYDGGSATIAPVGGNQVRMAPHAHVKWKEIDPLTGPQYLSGGCALHFGPVGRGATLEFVQCRRLGTWTEGELASETVQTQAAQPQISTRPHASQQGPPAAIEARRVSTIRTSTAPFWFLGCMFMMSMVTVATILVVVLVRPPEIEPLGPVHEGDEFYEYAEVDHDVLQEFGLLEGLEQPFAQFVMRYNREASGRRALQDPSNWDRDLYDRVAAAVHRHVGARRFFRRLDRVREHYAFVVEEMRRAGLPEIFAAIVYQESQFNPEALSPVCAKGWWQFMPEVAYRMERKHGLEFRVRNCRFTDAPADYRWNPEQLTPARPVLSAEYVTEGECRMPRSRTCEIDDRTDLRLSTAAAAVALKEAYDDSTLRRSGAVVQITVASHNAGYDDSRFGQARTTNLLPAFERWSEPRPFEEHPLFYGQNIKCPPVTEEFTCGSAIPRETQHYTYPIFAQHILAVCYYATNYSDMRAFSDWGPYVGRQGYCQQFNIPTPQEL